MTYDEASEVAANIIKTCEEANVVFANLRHESTIVLLVRAEYGEPRATGYNNFDNVLDHVRQHWLRVGGGQRA